MENVDITKISSKGQIVIPKEMRKKFRVGEKMVIMQSDTQLILKKMSDFKKNIAEDIEFAKRTMEAWEDIDKGAYKEYTAKEFLDKL